jgi:HEAT repeat protein
MKKACYAAIFVFCLVSFCEAKSSVSSAGLTVPSPAVLSTAPVSAAAQNYAVRTDTRTNIDKLSDPDWIVRRKAILYIGIEAKERNIKYLVKMLKDDSLDVRKTALQAILDSCVGAESRKAAARTILDNFDQEKNIAMQVNYVKALGTLKSKAAVPKLKLLLKHPYPLMRTYAVKTLTEINDPETYPLFPPLLVNEAESVRIEAARAVGKFRIRSAVPNLLADLDYQISGVRNAAAEALGEVGGEDAVPKLEKLLEDKDAQVAETAKAALAKIRNRKSVPK